MEEVRFRLNFVKDLPARNGFQVIDQELVFLQSRKNIGTNSLRIAHGQQGQVLRGVQKAQNGLECKGDASQLGENQS